MKRSMALALAVLPLLAPALAAQTESAKTAAGSNQFYLGYSLLTNSFNSHSYSGPNGDFRGAVLNGMEAAATFHPRGSFALKAEGLGFFGTSLGNSTLAQFFLGGGQYTRRMGRESGYAHLLGGLGHINKDALNLGGLGPTSNFSPAFDAGGGIDTHVSSNLSWRVEGALLFAHFTPKDDQIQNTPMFFGRFSTGIVCRF